MKYRTLKNMEKATKLIANKGYDWKTANEIAISCFDTAERNKNGMPIEWYIARVANNN